MSTMHVDISANVFEPPSPHPFLFSPTLGVLEVNVSAASQILVQSDVDFWPLQYQPLISACFFSAPKDHALVGELA
jgi:hypothetical protein